MEPLDQYVAEALAENPICASRAAGPACVLIVGGETDLRIKIVRTLYRRGITCTWVGGVNEARAAVARQRFDVVILNAQQPDGNGLELAPLFQKTSPATKIIVLSASNDLQEAVQAMRSGAADFVALPVQADELARRVDAALIKCRVDQQRDERLIRLKKICEELNIARHEISKQVDSLCSDLANVYEDMAEQMSEVAMASEFRTLLKQELDVEDLLRTTLEYMLIKTGPTNAAVFLPDAGREIGTYGLGAYVNYDCPRETIAVMLDHLCHAICPQMADETDIVSFDDAREFAQWVGSDAGFLADSQVIAFACRLPDSGDCLAVFVLFRNKSKSFDEKLAGVIDTLRQIIAEQLRHVIRVHQRAKTSWPKEAADGDLDDLGFGYEGGLAA